MRDFQIKNPQTNRWIKKDGPTYKKLVEEGIPIPESPSRHVPSYTPPEKGSYHVTKRFLHYPVDRSRESWTLKKPSKPSDRRKLLADCGASCFLVPESLKYPICNKDTSKGCQYNCGGIKAATKRAGEWKYEDVKARSQLVSLSKDCYLSKAAKKRAEKSAR